MTKHDERTPDEEAARRMRHRLSLEAALEHIPEYAIVLTDLDRRIVGWNRGAELLLGFPAAEAEGQVADIFFTPEDRARGIPEQEAATALRTGKALDERWHIRRDGSRFFGSGIMTPARDDAGVVSGFIKIFRDVTERQRAEAALARSEERYRILVESIKDYAIFMLDAAGRVTYWTKAAERIKGYTSREIVGRPFATFFTPEDRARGAAERELADAREQGRTEGVGWRVRKDGTRFWAHEVLTALYDAHGHLTGYSKITKDETERLRADTERERLLHQATEGNRLKDEFLGTISHELRTPLNAMLGWTRLMRQQGMTPQVLKQGLEVIERNARAQAHLIEDLLDVSRIVSGTTRLERQVVSIAEPLSAALAGARPAATEKGVALIVQHDAVRETVNGDPTRLQQIIWNILANAIKFTEPGGVVTVTTMSGSGHVHVIVSDTGVGIAPEFLPLVFERFRQADTSSTRAHGGLGVGLSIVRHLVEAHGGRVAVESEGKGRGTTVRLQLPLLDTANVDVEQARAPEVPASTALALAGVPIVVVDDEADTRHLLAMELSARGATVRTAASVRAGLEAVRETRPRVVLADLAMPAEDGIAIVRNLRVSPDEQLRALPVVAITAHARQEDQDRCMAAGFDAYLAKPIDLDQLIGVIRHLLDAPSPA